MVPSPFGITTGDPRGIGPEIISKSIFRLKNLLPPHRFLIFGNHDLYLQYQKYLPANFTLFSEKYFSQNQNLPLKRGHLHFVEPDCLESVKSVPGFLSGKCIELATLAAMNKKISAMITGPIDKTALNSAGFRFDGHTEMLQSICKSKSVTMMLVSRKLRVSLVTTHVPLSKVSEQLTSSKITSCALNTVIALKNAFKIRRPRIAVLALNPHAGDHGLFGSEEASVIIPAIRLIKKKLGNAAEIEGPFSADGFFANWSTKHHKHYDAVICQYHDQGLIPIKILDFKNTVNLTLGLPIIRTSVDHGTGFDIAGKNIADPSSLCAAIRLAIALSRNRKKG